MTTLTLKSVLEKRECLRMSRHREYELKRYKIRILDSIYVTKRLLGAFIDFPGLIVGFGHGP